MKRKQFLIVLSLLLIALTFFLWDKKNKLENASSAKSAQKTSLSRAADADMPEQSSSAARSIQRRAKTQGTLTTHTTDQLHDFILLECVGRKVSLQTALKIFHESYHDACYYSSETPLKLNFKIEGKSDRLVSFSIKGKSWKGTLDYIAALAGMNVQISGNDVVLSPIPPSDEKRSFLAILRPDAISALQQSLSEFENKEFPKDGMEIQKLLKLHGIINDETVVYDPKSGTLEVNATQPTLSALATFEALYKEQLAQIQINTKFISSDQELEIPKTLSNKTDEQKWMRELSMNKGVDVMSCPSIVTRNDEEGTIEIINGNEENWTGTKVTIESQHIGLKQEVKVKNEIRHKDVTEDPFHSQSRNLLYSGNSVFRFMGEYDGQFHYQMITAAEMNRDFSIDSLISTSTNTTENNPPANQVGSHPIAKPVPGKAGFVFSPYNNTVVDVTGIPSGTVVADPNYPVEQKKHFRTP